MYTYVWYTQRILRNCMCSTETPDRVGTPIPGRTEKDSTVSPPPTQNAELLKTGQLFISGICHSMFSECNRVWVTGSTEGAAVDEGGLLHSHPKDGQNPSLFPGVPSRGSQKRFSIVCGGGTATALTTTQWAHLWASRWKGDIITKLNPVRLMRTESGGI